MKNKKIIRKFTVLLAALVIMCGFSVTAYAGGGDESDDTPTPVTEETPAPSLRKTETIFTSSLTAPRTGKIPSISLTKWTKRI